MTRPTTFCLPVFSLSLNIWLQGHEPSTDPQTHQAWCCLRAFALTVATHWNSLSQRTARFSPFPLSLHSAVIFSVSCLCPLHCSCPCLHLSLPLVFSEASPSRPSRHGMRAAPCLSLLLGHKAHEGRSCSRPFPDVSPGSKHHLARGRCPVHSCQCCTHRPFVRNGCCWRWGAGAGSRVRTQTL